MAVVRVYSTAWPGAIRAIDTDSPGRPASSDSGGGLTDLVLKVLDLQASVEIFGREIPERERPKPWLFYVGVGAAVLVSIVVVRGVLK